MFGSWKAWRNKARLLSPLMHPPVMHPPVGRFYDTELRFPELQRVLRARGPELQPYEGLAEIWGEYNNAILPDYPAFLGGLARRRALKLRSVIDLACGAGELTKRLTVASDEVVGIDFSEPMLAQARHCCAELPSVHLIRGDFRDFSLGRQFDAAVCVSNSLNYVADLTELKRVFSNVAEHLRPGGLFVFDTFTEKGMKWLSGSYLHAQGKDWQFAIRFSYDARNRSETAKVFLSSGVETHRRIPIDPADVKEVCANKGLVVDDYFTLDFIPGRWWTGPHCFFVLTKRT